MGGTILRLGWTNPLSGAYGDHPALGSVLDLNDGVTFTLATPEGIELPTPARTLVTSGNIRTQGERAVRAIYRHNREVTARVIVGPMASYAALVATLRTLQQWVSAPPAVPITLLYQPFNASAPVYLDVVGAASDVPADESDWLRLQLEPIALTFVARPGLRGDRVTLSNLVSNPGFEAPGGAGVQVFSDTFATNDAYTLVSGSMPAVSANTLVIPASTTVAFGSPAWGAIQSWQVRWQYLTNLIAEFHLHKQDASNFLYAYAQGGSVTLAEVVGGAFHQLAQATFAGLTSGNWYWITFTQFPTVPGDPPYVQVALYADNAGAVGSQIGACGAATYDATTALVGKMEFTATNAVLTVGGAYPGVNSVSLFGPGGWLFGNASSGLVAGVWEGAGGNGSPTTYPNGPVASFGAARMDLPPAGTVNAYWTPYNGSAQPWANGALPVAAAGQTIAAVAHVKSGSLGANAALSLSLYEYDGNGTALRNTTVASVTGNQAAWTTLSGSVVTGAGTGYVSVFLGCVDLSAPGASAGGIVWWDNVQAWNVSTTGQPAGSMPYCELRFPQSPAQLVVSGLLGDLPAPAHLALGTYVSSLPLGGSLAYAVGRRGSVSANAQLVGQCVGWHSSALAPQATPQLDASAWGGWYEQATITGWNPRPLCATPADLAGTYHMVSRFLSQQAQANLANVQTRAVTQQRSQSWYGLLNGADQLGTYYGPYTAPLASSNAWTVCDSGQVALPPFNAGALTDPTQSYLTPRPQWQDLTGGGSLCQVNWGALLPIDGSLLVGVLNNPSNGPVALSTTFLWLYLDGLAVNRGGAADGPAWTWSQEPVALPNPGHAGGGPGTQTTGVVNINSGADPYLTLDPTLQINGGGGVNQLLGYIADANAAVLPLAAELQYTPLYLYPR